MKRWVLILGLMAMPLAAQPEDRVQKIVAVKYADPDAVRRMLGLFGVDATADRQMRVIGLSGPKSKVANAEDAIKQLDVPSAAQKDIDLMVYFVVGSDQNPPAGPNQPYGTIPADLQSTVATLKTTFPFKTYYLLDALSLRTRSGSGANTTGQLGGGRFTSFSVRAASLEGDSTMIRLDQLHAGLRIPHTGADGKGTYIDTGITTEIVSVKEGQKLVVGRSSLDGPSTALFLVLIGKVVN
jgi:hypothetical protein